MGAVVHDGGVPLVNALHRRLEIAVVEVDGDGYFRGFGDGRVNTVAHQCLGLSAGRAPEGDRKTDLAANPAGVFAKRTEDAVTGLNRPLREPILASAQVLYDAG